MATNFLEPILHARKSGRAYAYRTGMGMMSSAEWIVFPRRFVQAMSRLTSLQGGMRRLLILVVRSPMPSLAGGALLFDSDADDEGAATYLPKSVALNGKKFFMECRVKMEDVSAMTFQMGLSDLTATTNPEDIWTTTTTDYISFGNLDSAVCVLTYDKNNGGTVTETNSIGGVSTTTASNFGRRYLCDFSHCLRWCFYSGRWEPLSLGEWQ